MVKWDDTPHIPLKLDKDASFHLVSRMRLLLTDKGAHKL